MPTEDSPSGAVLICRAAPDAVAPAAHLLRTGMLLTGAGDEWSVLVPEGTPWTPDQTRADSGEGTGGSGNDSADSADSVDEVLARWAAALAVGAPWPVLGLWWDSGRAGLTVASGLRRPVGYGWLADGTPAGEDEALHTLAARLGLDPVLDVQDLEPLTRPDPEADAHARVGVLLAVLTRAGLTLPAGLTPGAPARALRDTARARDDVRRIDRRGWRDTVRTELDAMENAVEHSPLGPWLPWSGTPRAHVLALAQVTAAVPVTAWGLRRRSAGWIAAGALLLAHGLLGLAYDLGRPRD
ncbi:hypothetical protein [Streptomyces antibioticus]|uniref:hypothetical protein n=1 Tax=Streptomyces antibioticus TaxID=1890 RepID=UPI0033DB4E95